MVLLRDFDGEQPEGYTLPELVELTGFTERQIRHYISQEIVDGATGMGRNARYGEKTLRRLRLIRKLKDQNVEPLGRPLTLKEMKSTLDSLKEPEIDYLLSGTAAFKLIDTDMGINASPLNAQMSHDALDNEFAEYEEMRLRRKDLGLNTLSSRASAIQSPVHERTQREINSWVHELGDFGKLLQRLREILQDLAADDAPADPPGGDTWVRVKSTDVEVHVKAPRTATERARIRTIQRAVEMLIEQTPVPYNRY